MSDEAITDPAAFWDARYISRRRENGVVWSGRVNAAVEREVSTLTPGTALELGCGEGGDALWLATRGWTVTALDISANALTVGAAKAIRLGLADRIHWVRADLAAWHPASEYDLVTAAFLHSPVELPRQEILRRAVRAVAPGGRLLIVGHGAVPPGSDHGHDEPALPSPHDVLHALTLPDGWVVETAASIDRDVDSPEQVTTTLTDTVVRVRRPN